MNCKYDVLWFQELCSPEEVTSAKFCSNRDLFRSYTTTKMSSSTKKSTCKLPPNYITTDDIHHSLYPRTFILLIMLIFEYA